jgi:phosphoribosylpyrophosphate synthetase
MSLKDKIEMEIFIDNQTYEPGECVDGEIIIRINQKIKLEDVYIVF